jgi:hypothetical protein
VPDELEYQMSAAPTRFDRNTISPEAMGNKIHMLGDNVFSRHAMETLIERVRNLEMLGSLAKIMQLVAPQEPACAAIGGCHA